MEPAIQARVADAQAGYLGNVELELINGNRIDRALTKLESLARERGLAVGVASALPVSIDRIAAWTKALESRGIMLVPLTTAMLKSKSG